MRPRRVIETILSIQPRVTGAADADAKTPEQMVQDLAVETEKYMPLDLGALSLYTCQDAFPCVLYQRLQMWLDGYCCAAHAVTY